MYKQILLAESVIAAGWNSANASPLQAVKLGSHYCLYEY